jgi:hypothetical protein
VCPAVMSPKGRNGMNDRIKQLKAMSENAIIMLAYSMDIKTQGKKKSQLIKEIEKREFDDARTAEKLKHIKDIF